MHQRRKDRSFRAGSCLLFKNARLTARDPISPDDHEGPETMNDFPPPPPSGQDPYQPPQQPGQTDPTQVQPGQQQPGANDPTQVQPGQPQQGQYPPQAQQAYPPQGQPPVDPLEAANKKRKQQLAIVSVVGVALIIGSFFLGKSMEKKNYEPGEAGYTAIYNAGAKSGHAAGTKSGEQQGEKEGVAKGTEAGRQQGQAEGTAAGASAALGNLTNWSTSSPYIVKMVQGPSKEVPYAVDSRTQMQPNVFYKICDSGQGICTSTTNSGGGATGGGQ
jgi:hypothetical protein